MDVTAKQDRILPFPIKDMCRWICQDSEGNQTVIENSAGTKCLGAWERERWVLKSFRRGQNLGRSLIDCEGKIFVKHNVK